MNSYSIPGLKRSRMDLVGTQHPPFSTSRRGNNMYTGAESRRGYRRGREKRPPEFKKKKKSEAKGTRRVSEVMFQMKRGSFHPRDPYSSFLPSFLPRHPSCFCESFVSWFYTLLFFLHFILLRTLTITSWASIERTRPWNPCEERVSGFHED